MRLERLLGVHSIHRRSLAFLSPSADISRHKKRQPPDQCEGPTPIMTETTKTHVILLACGSFNPITKGHIQMFGESSRPPRRLLPLLYSLANIRIFQGDWAGRRAPLRRGAPADLSGAWSAPAITASESQRRLRFFQASLAWGQIASPRARGGGGAGLGVGGEYPLGWGGGYEL